MAKNKIKQGTFTTQNLVSFTAVVVSLCSLVLTIFQMHSDRESKYASVLPYVNCGVWEGNINKKDSTASFKMVITNEGIGPAFLRDIRLISRGEVFGPNDFHDAFEHFTGQNLKNQYVFSSIQPNRLLPSNQKIEWFIPTDSNSAYKILKHMWTEEGQHNFIIQICFADVYGNCWTFDTRYYQVNACKSCPL